MKLGMIDKTDGFEIEIQKCPMKELLECGWVACSKVLEL